MPLRCQISARSAEIWQQKMIGYHAAAGKTAHESGDARRAARMLAKVGRTFDVFLRRRDKRRDRGVDAAVVDGFHEDVARIRVALTG